MSVWWLRLRGYRVLARRFAVGVGEIDIVARRGRVVAVDEVKARADRNLLESPVTARQRQRIARAAEAFLARSPGLAEMDVRFDLMLVRPWRLTSTSGEPQPPEKPNLNWPKSFDDGLLDRNDFSCYSRLIYEDKFFAKEEHASWDFSPSVCNKWRTLQLKRL